MPSHESGAAHSESFQLYLSTELVANSTLRIIVAPRSSSAHMEADPFESLLGLEDQFYKEGYSLGLKDGTQAGLLEGRLFGIEKSFEKYSTMGILYGRSLVWAARLVEPEIRKDNDVIYQKFFAGNDGQSTHHEPNSKPIPPGQVEEIVSQRDSSPHAPRNTRLEKQVRILYALTEPSSLSTQNTEDSVAEFDDRLRRAHGKVKMIEMKLEESTMNRHSSKALSDSASSVTDYVVTVEDSIERGSPF